jgi:hypothetical protein
MIVYLKNSEIDRDQWDSCIKASRYNKPYAYSWYLDIMAPGWEALIDDDYDSVFPIPARKRFGIKYIATPIFLQQLGAFSPDKSSENAINEFLDYMPKFYRLVDLCVGQKVARKEFTLTERSNFELDLSIPYEKLWNNFYPECRRNIEKSSKRKIELVNDISPGELIDLFIAIKEKIIKGIKPRDFQHLNNLMDYCLKTKKGRIIGVRAPRNKIVFGQFIIEIPGHVNLFFGVNTQESRERRVNYFVINEIIREKATGHVILDFAGSSIPSVASFMASFGSINNPYYRIYRNTLPWPVRMLK